MKVGIIGGTFDPIHHGHLITAQRVLELRKLDKIIFIPCYISPHKQEHFSSAAEHRLKMIKLAIDGIPGFDYSDLEIQAEGVSYTIDTLKSLKKLYNKIELIIGYDNLISFDTWKEPDEIIRIASLVVMNRKVNDEPAVKHKYYDNAEHINTPFIEISGTEIRNRIKVGLPVNFLVPQKVLEYIYHFNLYK